MALSKWVSSQLWSAFMNDYNTNIDELNNAIGDTGWQPADLTASGLFKPYADDSANTPEYRKVGDIVHIRGVVSPVSEISYSTTNHTIFILPEAYRPSKNLQFVCQGSGITRWALTVMSTGAVAFARYGDGVGKPAPAGSSDYAWLPFAVTFFVD